MCFLAARICRGVSPRYSGLLPPRGWPIDAGTRAVAVTAWDARLAEAMALNGGQFVRLERLVVKPRSDMAAWVRIFFSPFFFFFLFGSAAG